MRLFQYRGIYHIAYPGNKRVSLHTRIKKEADKLFAEIVKEHKKGNVPISLEHIKRIKLSEVQEEYEKSRFGISSKTIKKDNLSFKLLISAVQDIQLRTLADDTLDDFKRKCLARGAKPQTINGYLRHIKATLNFCKDRKWIDEVPKIKMIRENKIHLSQRIIAPKDMPRIMEAAALIHPEFERFCQCLLWTGARRNEILTLHWQHVDFENKTIMLVGTKTKEDRCVPMLPEVEAVLSPHRKNIGRVFPAWFPDTTSKWFHAAALSCGVKARLHDLRHSAITYMLQSGININVVMKIVGHKNVSTTMIYTHIADDFMAREMAKMKIE